MSNIATLQAYDAGVTSDIDDKTGLPSTIPPVIVGGKYKGLSAIVQALIGGVLPSDLNTLIKITTELNTVRALIASGVTDGDAFVNTVTELLTAFSTFPEGVQVITEINARLLKSDVVANVTTSATGKALDASIGKILNDAITTINTALATKITADGSGRLPVDKLPLEIPAENLELVELIDSFSAQFYGAGGKVYIKDELVGADLIFRAIMDGLLHYWTPTFGTGNILGVGIVTQSASPTATGETYDPTTFIGSEPRGLLTSAASVGTRISARDTIPKYCLKYGFRGRIRWCIADAATVPGARLFAGFTTETGSINNVEPSSLFNIIGVGNDTADGNLHIMWNDASGVASRLDLGSQFPANTLSADVYTVDINAPANATEIVVTVVRQSAADGSITAVAEETITGNLPALTQGLTTQLWRSNAASALVMRLLVLRSAFLAKAI